MVATACTHPIDVVKLRQQLEHVGSKAQNTNMIRTGLVMVRAEGTSSLYSGLSAGLLRAMTYGGLRLGLYEPCKNLVSIERAKQSLLLKIVAGALAGSAATACTSPIELIKVRLQAPNANKQSTFLHEFRTIVREEGVHSLWKGLGPSMGRAAALTASQCAAYDESKQMLRQHANITEGFLLHLSASMMTGVIATAVSAPFDIVKSRMMVQKENSPRLYTNSLQCLYKVVHTEGIRGLYKGWAAMYARLGPQTAITFVVYEKMRQLVGMSEL